MRWFSKSFVHNIIIGFVNLSVMRNIPARTFTNNEFSEWSCGSQFNSCQLAGIGPFDKFKICKLFMLENSSCWECCVLLVLFCADVCSFFCSDVALVTSLRDGMNLVSYEFVACQDSKKGVLILSEVIANYSSFEIASDQFSVSCCMGCFGISTCTIVHIQMLIYASVSLFDTWKTVWNRLDPPVEPIDWGQEFIAIYKPWTGLYVIVMGIVFNHLSICIFVKSLDH